MIARLDRAEEDIACLLVGLEDLVARPHALLFVGRYPRPHAPLVVAPQRKVRAVGPEVRRAQEPFARVRLERPHLVRVLSQVVPPAELHVLDSRVAQERADLEAADPAVVVDVGFEERDGYVSGGALAGDPALGQLWYGTRPLSQADALVSQKIEVYWDLLSLQDPADAKSGTNTTLLSDSMPKGTSSY